MKIFNLHIENFGTLSDFSLELSENLVCIQRENGFGKTTLAAFIKAMFYGMAKKGNNKAYNIDRSKYKPWQGGVYGGQLIFESGQGKFQMVRTFADTPEGDTFEIIDLSTGLKSNKYSKNVGLELFGVGIETFEITAFFPQLDLAAGINDEVRASLVGANKFENDLAGFDKAKELLSDRMRQLKKLQVSKAELESLKHAKEQLGSRIDSLKAQQQTIAAQLERDKTELINVKQEYEKLSKKQTEIKQYNSEKNKIESEVFELQNKISELFTINLQPSQPQAKQNKKKTKLPIIIASTVALLCVLFVCLGALKVLSFVIAAICVIAVILVAILAFVLLSRKETDALRQQIERTKPKEGTSANQSLTLLNEQLNLKKLELASYSQVRDFDEEKLTGLQNRKFELEKELSLGEINYNSLSREIESAAEQFEELDSQFEFKQSEDAKARKDMKLLEKTLELMKQARENVSVRFMTPMQSSFEKYFNKVSNKQIKLDINFDTSLQTGVGGREFEYLSQGYRDIVSVCKRLTLIENVYKDEKPFIIMDDPFVNLDNPNFKVMKQILRDISKEYQILYLNCHDKTNL